MTTKFEKNNVIIETDSEDDSPPSIIGDEERTSEDSSEWEESKFSSIGRNSISFQQEDSTENFAQGVIEESNTEIEDASANDSLESGGEGSRDSSTQEIELIAEVIKSDSSLNTSRESNKNVSSDNELKILESSTSSSESDVYIIEDSREEEKKSVVDISKNRSVRSGSFAESLISNDSIPSSQKSRSSFESERSMLERQIADKQTAYQNLVKAVRSCNTKMLKDGGKLLEEKRVRCKEELDALKEKFKLLGDENEASPEIRKNKFETNSLFSTKDQVTSNLGKKGLETHRVEAALTIDALVTIHESLTTCPRENTFEVDPKGLKVELMPHQKYALAWLLWRERQVPSGGILADDMGLGKTLSIISLILRSEEYKEGVQEDEEEEQGSMKIVDGLRTYKGKTLVVCPASLAGQWEGQIKKHCRKDLLKVVVHHGKTREYQARRLAAYDVVITTYGLLAEENKSDDYRKKGILYRVRWDRVVLDEAHVIRNHKTQKAIAACDLTAKFRWCLTGTPVHNRELDMYSLLKFLRCSPFDDRVVWKRWVDNKSANGVQRLKTVIKSILLRRTKEDLRSQGELTELPNKELIPVYIDLDEEELKVYHKVLNYSKTLLAEYLHQKDLQAGGNSDRINVVRNQLKSVEDIKTTEILVLLLRLRQVCCLPGLIHSFLEKETCIESGIEPENPVIEDLYTQLNRLSISNKKPMEDFFSDKPEKNVLLKTNPVFKLSRPSTKIQELVKIVEDVLDTDDKIVIVSQWVNVLRKLESHLNKLDVGIVTLDGSIPVKFRSKIIDDFNDPDTKVRIMLLSLNAGGVGLNLIGGNRLIIFEPHWNPQLESQACDRVYRVGQKKQVFIYKIICRNTIEEKIEQLQKKKLELAKNMLAGVDPNLKSQTLLSLPDLITLFDIGQPVG